MPTITLPDLSLSSYSLSDGNDLARLRSDYFRALPEVCTERPRLVTQYHLENGLLEKDRITILDKAKAYRSVLENRQPLVRHEQGYEQTNGKMRTFSVHDRSPFAGSTTSKFKGVLIYPELIGLILWPDLLTLRERTANPYHITDEEIRELNLKIFPHWMKKNVLEITRAKYFPSQFESPQAGEKSLDEMKLLQNIVFFLTSKELCISHTVPDFSRAIREGLRTIIEDAASRRAATVPGSEQQLFYLAIEEALEGIIAYARRLSREAERLAKTEDGKNPAEAARLREIAEIYGRVPEEPARTFRDGLTTVWICWTAIHLENPNVGLSLGRLDQILYSLYRKDVDRGALTPEQAVELVSYLWLKIGDHVPTMPETGEQLFGGTGSNQAITIGGVDENGADAVNDLTYVMLRATEIMVMRDPNLNARYHRDKHGDDYLRRLCQVNITTCATPAIHNDAAIIKAMCAKGANIQHARDYAVVGCVEPCSNGRHYGHSASILLNLPAALELTLYSGWHRRTGIDPTTHPRIGPDTGDPASFSTFEQFKAAFQTHAEWLAGRATYLNNLMGTTHQEYYPTPILSALFEGPMQNGKDLIQGGAVINSSGVAIIGLADVADSLSAIEKVVYKDKAASFKELLEALDKDFQGGIGIEALHKRVLKAPKFGNSNRAADANARWLVEMLDKTFQDKWNYRGGRYRVGYWTMTIHAGLGRLTQALPNGRKTGENLASGITPVSGETPSLTAALNSVACLPAESLSSGVALNIKYTPETRDPEMLDNFVASVKGAFDSMNGSRDGAVEVQFNIMDHQTLVDAVSSGQIPGELLVRVSGYTAYFKDLNPRMQKEIIDRTEYLLSSGVMQHYEPFPLGGKTPKP